MNALRGRERESLDYGEQRADYREQRPAYRERANDREISLGMGTILGIFFALALVCAVFFGFGYSIGRKSYAQSVSAPAEASGSGSIFSSFKPPAGKPLGSVYQERKSAALSIVNPGAASVDDGSSGPSAAVQSAPVKPDQSGPDASKPPAAPVSVTTRPQAKIPSAVSPGAAVSATVPPTDPNGTAMVQVAAVSHQEDADLLLSALKKRGYEVFIRHEAQDRLLHVQVGPFATRKDADIMRQRLLSDGYNAMVK